MRWGVSALKALAVAWMLSAVCAPAFAQTPDAPEEQEVEDEPFDRDCMDDYGRDLCDPALWSDIIASFELQPAEEVQQQGWRGVRVFTVNGYSNDMPMVSVLATTFDRWGDPVDGKLEVRGAVYRNGDKVIAPMLEREAWDGLYSTAEWLQELVAGSSVRQSDDEPKPEPKQSDNDDSDVISICLHAWVTITESLTDQGVIRRIRNACGDDPVFDASFDFSAHALRGFPHCNHIDPATERNQSTQLQTCLALVGEDRIAAAELENQLSGGAGDLEGILEALAPDFKLVIAGTSQPLSGAEAVDVLRGESFFDMQFGRYQLEGAADRVVVVGEIWRYFPEDDDKTEVADLRETWVRRDGVWRLADMTIGPRSLLE